MAFNLVGDVAAFIKQAPDGDLVSSDVAFLFASAEMAGELEGSDGDRSIIRHWDSDWQKRTRMSSSVLKRHKQRWVKRGFLTLITRGGNGRASVYRFQVVGLQRATTPLDLGFEAPQRATTAPVDTTAEEVVALQRATTTELWPAGDPVYPSTRNYSPPTPQGTQRSLLIHAVPGGEGEIQPIEDTTAADAAALLAALPAKFQRKMGDGQQAKALPGIRERLAAGWPVAELVKLLVEDSPGVIELPGGFLANRMTDRIPVAYAGSVRPTQSGPTYRPVREVLAAGCPDCGNNDRSRPRFVPSDPDDLDSPVIKCRTCDPARMGATA